MGSAVLLCLLQVVIIIQYYFLPRRVMAARSKTADILRNHVKVLISVTTSGHVSQGIKEFFRTNPRIPCYGG